MTGDLWEYAALDSVRRLTDEAAKKITTVASTGESSGKVNNIPAGYAAAPAASADENVLVKLLG